MTKFQRSFLICCIMLGLLGLAAQGARSQEQAAPPATLQRVTGSGDASTTIPIPDPTKLTTEAVDRLKEQLTTQFGQQIEFLQKEIVRMQKEIENRPVLVVVEEKFKGVGDQFIARDNNLATALTAQKDDAAKTERNFGTQIGNTIKAIDDLKDRVTRFESASAGAGGAVNWVIAAISVFLALVGGIIGVVSFMKTPVPIVQYTEQPQRSTK